MEHSINNIRMYIEQSGNKYLLSAYYNCQVLCLVAGYTVRLSSVYLIFFLMKLVVQRSSFQIFATEIHSKKYIRPDQGLNWLEHHPIQQKIVGSISGQVTYLGCGFDPQSEHIWEAVSHCFFLSLRSVRIFFLKYILHYELICLCRCSCIHIHVKNNFLFLHAVYSVIFYSIQLKNRTELC